MVVEELKPQFLIDKSGKRSFVVLTIEEYEELLEDLHDLSVMASRRNEPRISLEDVEKSLKRDGLL